MSEAFVKRFKQHYAYVNELWDAEVVLTKLQAWVRRLQGSGFAA